MRGLVVFVLILAVLGCIESNTEPTTTTTIQKVIPTSTTQRQTTTTSQPTTTSTTSSTTTTLSIFLGEEVIGEDGLVSRNNEFAIQTFQNLREPGENLFFSPFSISTALAMTYEGAKGDTATEMRDILGFPEDEGKRLVGFKSLIESLTQPNDKYVLKINNALWAQKNYPFKKDFLTSLDGFYKGKATGLDFVTMPDESRITINKWVENKTNNLIKNLLPEGIIKVNTRLVLTNTIYFFANWSRQFDGRKTSKQDFTLSNGEKVKVDLMHMTSFPPRIPYYEDDDLQAISLSYKGGRFNMIILLPKNITSSNFKENLSYTQIRSIQNSFSNEEVKLMLPKFKMEYELNLHEYFKQQGMVKAFEPGAADFTKMADPSETGENLFIDNIVHKAVVEVNEVGTEAAAATAVIMAGATSAHQDPYKIFRADHPFIFLIEDQKTGQIIFIGKLSNPSMIVS